MSPKYKMLSTVLAIGGAGGGVATSIILSASNSTDRTKLVDQDLRNAKQISSKNESYSPLTSQNIETAIREAEKKFKSNQRIGKDENFFRDIDTSKVTQLIRLVESSRNGNYSSSSFQSFLLSSKERKDLLVLYAAFVAIDPRVTEVSESSMNRESKNKIFEKFKSEMALDALDEIGWDDEKILLIERTKDNVKWSDLHWEVNPFSCFYKDEREWKEKLNKLLDGSIRSSREEAETEIVFDILSWLVDDMKEIYTRWNGVNNLERLLIK